VTCVVLIGFLIKVSDAGKEETKSQKTANAVHFLTREEGEGGGGGERELDK
jgi:hypothetical protein